MENSSKMNENNTLFDQFDAINGKTTNPELQEWIKTRNMIKEEQDTLLVNIREMIDNVEHSNMLLDKYEKQVKEMVIK